MVSDIHNLVLRYSVAICDNITCVYKTFFEREIITLFTCSASLEVFTIFIFSV